MLLPGSLLRLPPGWGDVSGDTDRQTPNLRVNLSAMEVILHLVTADPPPAPAPPPVSQHLFSVVEKSRFGLK